MHSVKPPDRPAYDRWRVGVVGLDHYHVTGWVETLEAFSDQLEIVALYDPDPQRGQAMAPRYHDPALRPSLGEAYRPLPFETDLATMIERHRVEIALVTLPNADAPDAIEQLAAAGIHLLVDKPAARTADEARRAFGAARAAGVVAVVGLTKRYSPAHREARAFIADGRLGRLITAESLFATGSVEVRGVGNPLFDPDSAGGGILSWLGIHDLDALLWLSGERIDEVVAMTASVGEPSLRVENVSSVSLRFEGGAVGVAHHAYALPGSGYRSTLALRGTDASLELGLSEDLTVLTIDAPGGPLVIEERHFDVEPAGGYGVGGRAAVEDLLACIASGGEPRAGGEALVDVLSVIDAAYASARDGRVTSVAASDRGTD